MMQDMTPEQAGTMPAQQPINIDAIKAELAAADRKISTRNPNDIIFPEYLKGDSQAIGIHQQILRETAQETPNVNTLRDLYRRLHEREICITLGLTKEEVKAKHIRYVLRTDSEPLSTTQNSSITQLRGDRWIASYGVDGTTIKLDQLYNDFVGRESVTFSGTNFKRLPQKDQLKLRNETKFQTWFAENYSQLSEILQYKGVHDQLTFGLPLNICLGAFNGEDKERVGILHPPHCIDYSIRGGSLTGMTTDAPLSLGFPYESPLATYPCRIIIMYKPTETKNLAVQGIGISDSTFFDIVTGEPQTIDPSHMLQIAAFSNAENATYLAIEGLSDTENSFRIAARNQLDRLTELRKKMPELTGVLTVACMLLNHHVIAHNTDEINTFFADFFAAENLRKAASLIAAREQAEACIENMQRIISEHSSRTDEEKAQKAHLTNIALMAQTKLTAITEQIAKSFTGEVSSDEIIAKFNALTQYKELFDTEKALFLAVRSQKENVKTRVLTTLTNIESQAALIGDAQTATSTLTSLHTRYQAFSAAKQRFEETVQAGQQQIGFAQVIQTKQSEADRRLSSMFTDITLGNLTTELNTAQGHYQRFFSIRQHLETAIQMGQNTKPISRNLRRIIGQAKAQLATIDQMARDPSTTKQAVQKLAVLTVNYQAFFTARQALEELLQADPIAPKSQVKAARKELSAIESQLAEKEITLEDAINQLADLSMEYQFTSEKQERQTLNTQLQADLEKESNVVLQASLRRMISDLDTIDVNAATPQSLSLFALHTETDTAAMHATQNKYQEKEAELRPPFNAKLHQIYNTKDIPKMAQDLRSSISAYSENEQDQQTKQKALNQSHDLSHACLSFRREYALATIRQQLTTGIVENFEENVRQALQTPPPVNADHLTPQETTHQKYREIPFIQARNKLKRVIVLTPPYPSRIIEDAKTVLRLATDARDLTAATYHLSGLASDSQPKDNLPGLKTLADGLKAKSQPATFSWKPLIWTGFAALFLGPVGWIGGAALMIVGAVGQYRHNKQQKAIQAYEKLHEPLPQVTTKPAATTAPAAIPAVQQEEAVVVPVEETPPSRDATATPPPSSLDAAPSGARPFDRTSPPVVVEEKARVPHYPIVPALSTSTGMLITGQLGSSPPPSPPPTPRTGAKEAMDAIQKQDLANSITTLSAATAMPEKVKTALLSTVQQIIQTAISNAAQLTPQATIESAAQQTANAIQKAAESTPQVTTIKQKETHEVDIPQTVKIIVQIVAQAVAAQALITQAVVTQAMAIQAVQTAMQAAVQTAQARAATGELPSEHARSTLRT